MEYLRVDAVMNDTDVVIPEEGLLHLAPYPFGNRHKRQAVMRQRGESVFLIYIILSASVEKPARRELFPLRAMVTTGLPFPALHVGVVIAVAGVEPAIVYRPHHRNAFGGQIVEQDFVVQEITMNVMYMNNVGTDVFYLPDELPCSSRRGQSVTVEQARFHAVPRRTPSPAHRNDFGAAGLDAVTATTVGDVALPAVADGQFSYLLHDASRRGRDTQHWIYLK